MTNELSPPPEPKVAQLFALVMEECEAARADRKAILAALHNLTQLSATNAVNNAILMKEHQCLNAGEFRKRKRMTQGEASTPRSRCTSPPPKEPAYARSTQSLFPDALLVERKGTLLVSVPKGVMF